MAKNNGEEKNEVALFISQAIEKNLPVETMEKLFALREKVKAEQAREAYVEALAVFQSKCPAIKKTKKVMNKDGRTVRYTYAPLDTIAEQIKKPLAEQGLSYSWEVENKEGLIKATAKVTHKLGHSETSSFEVPIDKEGFMTAPQKFASALTFAKDILSATSSVSLRATRTPTQWMLERRRVPSHQNPGLFSFSGLLETTRQPKKAHRMPSTSEPGLIWRKRIMARSFPD